ncbi:hypothetical protein ABEB36_015087 [Hypothenemus hampei]|uniref:Uncharacterized protein n=1 Tax=Hypothenemus hampei TaxID=57062 RepID=A0ABD1E0N4_HYPHA
MAYFVSPAKSKKELAQANQVLLHENSQRSQNEQLLYNSLKTAEQEKINATNRVEQLQNQLNKIHKLYEELSKKYSELESQLTNNLGEKTTEEYNTDEEELARETEWIRARSRKKRRMDTSVTPPQQQTNRPKEERPKKTQVPPPIVVDNINNFNELHALVNQFSGTQIKVIHDKNIKINLQEETNYKMLTALLNEKEYSWHSFENKQNRPIKVMANKLYHSIEPEK